jgi:hypothetical protein
VFTFDYGLGVCWWCNDVEVFVVVFFGLWRIGVHICICLVSSASVYFKLGDADIPSTSLIRGVLVSVITCSMDAASVAAFAGGESAEAMSFPSSNFDQRFTTIY